MDKQNIENLIRDLIQKTKVEVRDVLVEESDGKIWFAVEVSEPHFFTKHEGEALHALNHLVRRILDKSTSPESEDKPETILIDINGFQKNKVESVKALAHMMSERARYFKSSVEVDPMSAFERRIVHEFLSNATDLKTESTGFGKDRRVVIKYIGTSV